MSSEKSCGAVVFTRDGGRIRYVIVKSKNGVYGFPKGHVEAGETEEETAEREVLEETGLRVRFLPDFRAEDRYDTVYHGKTVHRFIVYFLAEYSEQDIKIPEAELSEARLTDFEEALTLLEFDGVRQILREVNAILVGDFTGV